MGPASCVNKALFLLKDSLQHILETLTAPWFSPKFPLFPELPPPNLSTAPCPPLLLCWQTSESLSVGFSLLSRIFSSLKGEHLRAEIQGNQLISFYQSTCMHQHWPSKFVLVVKYWRPWVKKIRGPRGNCRCAHSSRVPYLTATSSLVLAQQG